MSQVLPLRFLGRRLVLTTLDPLPTGLRTMPGALAVRQCELDHLRRGPAAAESGETFKALAGFCYRADGPALDGEGEV